MNAMTCESINTKDRGSKSETRGKAKDDFVV